MKYTLKNCFDDICELDIDLENVKYIFRSVISGDEVYRVVYKDGSIVKYDSDMHFRCESWYEELEMVYPEHIDLFDTEDVDPNEKDNFVCIKKT